MKAFISYASEERRWAAAVKAVFDDCRVPAFLAHEDIAVSDEWKTQILEQLRDADVFVALLSAAFRASDWCAQELGIAYARPDLLVVPLSVDDTMPFGFIGNLQGRRMNHDSDAEELIPSAVLGKRFMDGVDMVLAMLRGARGYRQGERALRPLRPHFGQLSPEQAEAIASACIENAQVWDATECWRDLLPEFLRHNRAKLAANTLRRLEFQITEHTWYREAQPQE